MRYSQGDTAFTTIITVSFTIYSILFCGEELFSCLFSQLSALWTPLQERKKTCRLSAKSRGLECCLIRYMQAWTKTREVNLRFHYHHSIESKPLRVLASLIFCHFMRLVKAPKYSSVHFSILTGIRVPFGTLISIFQRRALANYNFSNLKFHLRKKPLNFQIWNFAAENGLIFFKYEISTFKMKCYSSNMKFDHTKSERNHWKMKFHYANSRIFLKIWNSFQKISKNILKY